MILILIDINNIYILISTITTRLITMRSQPNNFEVVVVVVVDIVIVFT